MSIQHTASTASNCQDMTIGTCEFLGPELEEGRIGIGIGIGIPNPGRRKAHAGCRCVFDGQDVIHNKVPYRIKCHACRLFQCTLLGLLSIGQYDIFGSSNNISKRDIRYSGQYYIESSLSTFHVSFHSVLVPMSKFHIEAVLYCAVPYRLSFHIAITDIRARAVP